LALNLIVKYGLRRGGLANVQMKHLDWDRRILTVHTKGGRIHTLPIPDPAFWSKLLALQATGLGPDSYLLYRRDSRKRKVPIDEADEVLELGGGRMQGYAWVTDRFHDRKIAGNSVHRWWYRCLENAAFVPHGTTAGLNMHRGRHTSITAIVRDSGLAVAKQLAGHIDIKTTDRYSHLDTGDLEQALISVYHLGED
jgi:integrase